MIGIMFHLTTEFGLPLGLVSELKVFEHLIHNFDRDHRALL